MEDLRNKLSNIYLIVLMIGLPLIMTNGYYNITQTKYLFFFFTTIAYVVVAGITMLYDAISYGLDHEGLSLPIYICLGIMMIAACISTFISPYHTLIGASSRYQGLIPILLYGVAILLISQSQLKIKWIINAILTTSIIVNGLTLIHYLGIDPFGFFKSASLEQSIKFISTIGNVDFFSGYQTLTFPMILILFIQANEFNILYAISLIMSITGVICCPSDSGIVGIAIALVIIPLLIKEHQSLKRLLLIGIIFCAMGFLLSLIPTHYPHNILASLLSSPIIAGLFIIILSGSYICLQKQKGQFLIDRYPLILGVVITLCLVALAFVNINHIDLGRYNQYFIFNRKWGTSRGKIWGFCWRLFTQLPLMQKLLGVGCDSLKEIANNTGTFRNVLNAAHNEYLNYLICQGLIGTLSYCGLCLLSIVQGIRSRLSDTFILPFTLAIVAYSIQAFFNIAQPNTTPLFFITLGILLSLTIHPVKS